MAEKRLIGSDGEIIIGQYGPELTDGDILSSDKSYVIDAIDPTNSVFPPGAEVGYLYDATQDIPLAAGDICRHFSGTKLCDIQSWSMDFSKAEVDVTTLCDETKSYRASKYDDITGNLEGVMTTEITDAPNGLLNQFVTIVEQDGDTSMTIMPKEGVEVYAQLFTDNTEVSGEVTGYYFTPIVLTGFSASAGGDDAQTFSTPFRIAPSPVGVCYYRIKNA